MNSNRRFILKALAAGGVMSATLGGCSRVSNPQQAEQSSSDKDWLKAQSIRDAIVVPSFAEQQFNIVDFGAQSGSDHDCTESIKAAIQQCHESGGGQVRVPAGIFYTGAVHLLSNVNLHIAKGATLKFITDPKKYLPAVFTRWEGLEMMGYSPLIYAYKQKNIAVTGEGTLDGSANNQTWWPWKGPHKEAHWDHIVGEDQKPARMKLMQDAENGVPVAERVYAEGAFLRPPFVQPYECENVLIEGIKVKDSPFWLLNPVLCKSVTVRGVTMQSHGPNSDGCDPESCDHVLIENCTFDTGDDCIAIKSGRNADGRRVATPSQNIVIANCHMREGHGGVVIGSEISGGVNNVFVEDCTMDSPELERAIRIKTNSIRGGVIEHLRYRNINVGKVKNAIVVNFFYEEGDAGTFDPTVRDIIIENMDCQQVLKKPLYLQGFERAPMYDIKLKNCHFNNTGEDSIVRHVNNMTLDNVTIDGKTVALNDVLSPS
ncbi:glycoside hydrolase family 28 protein [Alteromonadaceae bacterium BrNp21-10]|nr:glycoside hydrolase family 28 protein [Alteromonadaceae bacterium BrNp21-10]